METGREKMGKDRSKGENDGSFILQNVAFRYGW
jgi:hypothetical protein